MTDPTVVIKGQSGGDIKGTQKRSVREVTIIQHFTVAVPLNLCEREGALATHVLSDGA